MDNIKWIAHNYCIHATLEDTDKITSRMGLDGMGHPQYHPNFIIENSQISHRLSTKSATSYYLWLTLAHG